MSYNHSFIFQDVESTGLNLDYDQVLQYAAVRTDADLNIIPESSINLLCRPRLDVVPHPQAYLTHHIDIENLLRNGMPEFELARRIRNFLLAEPNTVLSGFNTISYDDEVLRRLFLREMKDSYEHEYKNGNLRFDVYRLIQMIYALRPETLAWPTKEDGSTSLKLELLTKENGIEHQSAHDALSDVYATIALAKLIKNRNEKAFQYMLRMSRKDEVKNLLLSRRPLLHVAKAHGAEYRNASLIYPVVMDKTNRNKFICVDLRRDLDDLLHMSAEDIRKYRFTKREDLPELSPTIPTVAVQCNKQPILVEIPNNPSSEFLQRFGLDYEACLGRIRAIEGNSSLKARLHDAYDIVYDNYSDPYATIYSAPFFSDSERALRAKAGAPAGEATPDLPMLRFASVYDLAAETKDKARNFDLFLRAKWLNYYTDLLKDDSCSPSELQAFVGYLQFRLYSQDGHSGLTISDFHKETALIRMERPLTEDEERVLAGVCRFVALIEKRFAQLRELSASLAPDALEEELSNGSIGIVNNAKLGEHGRAKDAQCAQKAGASLGR